MVDRLLGLGFHSVVGGHHDHGDVCDLGAARAHGRERLVAGRVEESDGLVRVMHLVSADVLGDPAGLTRRHLGLADRVKQRGLAVVDVTHDRHYRRPLDQLVFGIGVDRLGDGLVFGVHELDLFAELRCKQQYGLIGEGLRQRLHLAERHQFLHHLGHRNVEVLGDVLDGRARVDENGSRPAAERRGRGPGFGLLVIDATPAPIHGAGGVGLNRWRGTAGCTARGLESITTLRRPPALPGARSP